MQKKIIFYTVAMSVGLFSTSYTAYDTMQAGNCQFIEVYRKPAAVSAETWNAVAPYLLPSDHPAKNKLDEIFSKSRPVASSDALKKSGFVPLDDKEQDLIVARHPQINGYLIKLYYDDHNIPDRNGVPGEAQYWINRIEGADRVRRSIAQHHLENDFTVPKKWIYPIPDSRSVACNGQKDCFPKHFILVSEDLDLVTPAENEKLYKEKMTPQMLEGLYTIIYETHLYDSIYIDNNIFTKQGKIAFIDTEDLDRKPIYFSDMTKYFSEEMQPYWLNLLKERGATIPPRVHGPVTPQKG